MECSVWSRQRRSISRPARSSLVPVSQCLSPALSLVRAATMLGCTEWSSALHALRSLLSTFISSGLYPDIGSRSRSYTVHFARIIVRGLCRRIIIGCSVLVYVGLMVVCSLEYKKRRFCSINSPYCIKKYIFCAINLHN